MSEIQTVRGQVDSADLGVTLMHEHVFVLTADVQTNYPGEWGPKRIGSPTPSQNSRRPTTRGADHRRPDGRGTGALHPADPDDRRTGSAEHRGGHGVYTYTEVPFFFDIRGPALNELVGAEVPDPMVEMFIGDIRDGIAGTGVKAGMLKCAIEHQGLTLASSG